LVIQFESEIGYTLVIIKSSQRTYKPDFVSARADGNHFSKRPTQRLAGFPASGEQPSEAVLHGLAPRGACHARIVAFAPVGSYPAFSPLSAIGGRYIFCDAFRRRSFWMRLPRLFIRAAHCPLESGLSSPRRSISRKGRHILRLERLPGTPRRNSEIKEICFGNKYGTESKYA